MNALVKQVIFVPFGFFVLCIFESENYKWTTTAAVGMLVCPVVVRSDSHAIRITNTFLPYFLGPRSLWPKTQCADSEEIPKRTINETLQCDRKEKRCHRDNFVKYHKITAVSHVTNMFFGELASSAGAICGTRYMVF